MRIQLWDPLVGLVTAGFLDHHGKATLDQLTEHLAVELKKLSLHTRVELRDRIEDVLLVYGGTRFERVHKTPPTWKLLPPGRPPRRPR